MLLLDEFYVHMGMQRCVVHARDACCVLYNPVVQRLARALDCSCSPMPYAWRADAALQGMQPRWQIRSLAAGCVRVLAAPWPCACAVRHAACRLLKHHLLPTSPAAQFLHRPDGGGFKPQPSTAAPITAPPCRMSLQAIPGSVPGSASSWSAWRCSRGNAGWCPAHPMSSTVLEFGGSTVGVSNALLHPLVYLICRMTIQQCI